MATNDEILMTSLLDARKKEAAPKLEESDFFELYTAEQVLKRYDLGLTEIQEGQTGGGNDGGIDSVHILVNGRLISAIEEIDTTGSKPSIELHLIQATRKSSFEENKLVKMIATAEDAFIDLGADVRTISQKYSQILVEKSNLFRESVRRLASRHPDVSVTSWYVSLGDVNSINSVIKARATGFESLVNAKLPRARGSVRFVGAKELFELDQRQPSKTLKLPASEILTRSASEYACLVPLGNFFDFVSDDEGILRRHLFESNVRDYQGSVQVNQDIARTLRDDSDVQFWWLNNGVTVLASTATQAGKELSLTDVQIVNGLQTTTEIHHHFYTLSPEQRKADKREILVRVFLSDDPRVRDKVIRATNSQTQIPPASLRATDTIHRRIDEFFKANEWYYDRRKNQYRNLGKPLDQIVPIPFLAQAVETLCLGAPEIARAKPTSLLRDDGDYRSVFSETRELQVYLSAASFLRAMEIFLRYALTDFTAAYRRNIRFHVAYVGAGMCLNRWPSGDQDVKLLGVESVSYALMMQALAKTAAILELYKSEPGVPSGNDDLIVKSRAFTDYVRSKADLKVAPNAQE